LRLRGRGAKKSDGTRGDQICRVEIVVKLRPDDTEPSTCSKKRQADGLDGGAQLLRIFLPTPSLATAASYVAGQNQMTSADTKTLPSFLSFLVLFPGAVMR